MKACVFIFAMPVLLLTACDLSDRGASIDNESPALVPARASAASTQKGFKDLTKNIVVRRHKWDEDEREVNQAIDSLRIKVLEHEQLGEWIEAEQKLDQIQSKFDEFAARWPKAKFHEPLDYRRLRAEALVGLRKPQEALELLGGAHPGMQSQWTLTSGLAAAMLGQLDEEEALAFKAMILKTYEDYPLIPVPEVRTRQGRLAMVRLARAVDRYYAMEATVVEREARAVLDAVPGQPLAAFYVGACLAGRGKGAESVPYFKMAEKMPYHYGKEARQFIKRYDTL